MVVSNNKTYFDFTKEPGDVRLRNYVVEAVVRQALGQRMDWGISLLNVPEAWKKSRGKGVKIAVLDTGRPNHSDLKGNIKGSACFTNDGVDDGQGHSTHCIGIAAAEDNEFGVVGVAPEADVYAVKVLTNRGSGSYEGIAKGIYWCIENDIDVISMSLGSDYPSDILHEAIKAAYAKNITIVCAAGNDGRHVDYPGKYPEVITVGAIDSDKDPASFSSPGKKKAVDVVAPGVRNNSTYLNNDYAILSGTSMATPFVTGVIALIISKHRNSLTSKTPVDTPDRIREHLWRTADDIGRVGYDGKTGFGIVDPDGAMQGLALKNLYV